MAWIYTHKPIPGPRHPVAAGLAAVAVSAVLSAALNGAWLLVDKLWSNVFLNLVILYVVIAVVATWLGIAAASTRSARRTVVVAVLAGLVAIYLGAWWLGVDPVTHWLYPHWPGSDPPFAPGPIFVFLLCAGIFCYGAYDFCITHNSERVGTYRFVSRYDRKKWWTRDGWGGSGFDPFDELLSRGGAQRSGGDDYEVDFD